MSETVELLKKTKTKKVDDKDLIMDISEEYENLGQDQLEELAHELDDMEGQNEFRLGAVFSVIQSNQYYGDYANFKEYVETNYRTDYGKALHCIKIYIKLTSEKIKWDSVKDLGWTKLMIIQPVLTNENLDHWVATAKNSNCLNLKVAVKAALGGTVEVDTTQPTSELVTMTFKLHSDEKEVVKAALDHVKAEIANPNGTTDSTALGFMCDAFLGGNAPLKQDVAPKGDLSSLMKAAGWQKSLEIYGDLYSDIYLEVTTYEVDVSEGFVGSKEDWLAWLPEKAKYVAKAVNAAIAAQAKAAKEAEAA